MVLVLPVLLLPQTKILKLTSSMDGGRFGLSKNPALFKVIWISMVEQLLFIMVKLFIFSIQN